MSALVATLLLVLPGQDDERAPQLAPKSGFTVDVHFEDGSTTLSIEAREAPAASLMGVVASKLGLDLTGFEAITREANVNTFLHRRPYREAVRWTLGSVGLRARIDSGTIHVYEDVTPYPTSSEVLEEANRRYLQALREHPDWPQADRAEMARAKINERLGPEFWGAAALSYDTLIRSYPTSDIIPEAMLRSARLLGRLGSWERAVLRYEELAQLSGEHPYHVTARLELGKALCRVGEGSDEPARQRDQGTKARFYLDALDNNYTTTDPQQRRARLLVRSRARSLSGEPILALRALDAAARFSTAGERDPELLELRARALSRAGDHGSAARAWLAYGEELSGEEHERAYEEAAREALAGGHEIGALTIAKAAEAEAFGGRLAAAANEAKARLGFPTADLSAFDAQQHLRRGQKLAKRDMWEQAVDALRLAYVQRSALGSQDFLQLALAYATALDRSGVPDDGVQVLRGMLADMPKRIHREEVYRLASRLYERRGLLPEAIDALRGRL